jgi:IclR family acetate operon transcriptional repressor
MKRESEQNPVKVLRKAFQILEALHRTAKGGARLSEIVAAVKLPKPTVFRILRTLEALGYVAFDGALETYRISQRLKDLGQSNVSELVSRLARPIMMTLLAEFEQTVNLALFEDGRLVYRDMLEGLRSVRMQPIPGVFLSMTESALGKSILAFLPKEQVLSLMRMSNISARNSGRNEPTGLLLQELDKVRRDGFAVDDEQVEKGLRCVGAPIFDQNGKPIASISVSGSTSVLHGPVMRKVAKKVKRACDEISQELGFLPQRMAI